MAINSTGGATKYHLFSLRVPKEIHEKLRALADEETERQGFPVPMCRLCLRFIKEGLIKVGSVKR